MDIESTDRLNDRSVKKPESTEEKEGTSNFLQWFKSYGWIVIVAILSAAITFIVIYVVVIQPSTAAAKILALTTSTTTFMISKKPKVTTTFTSKTLSTTTGTTSTPAYNPYSIVPMWSLTSNQSYWLYEPKNLLYKGNLIDTVNIVANYEISFNITVLCESPADSAAEIFQFTAACCGREQNVVGFYLAPQSTSLNIVFNEFSKAGSSAGLHDEIYGNEVPGLTIPLNTFTMVKVQVFGKSVSVYFNYKLVYDYFASSLPYSGETDLYVSDPVNEPAVAMLYGLNFDSTSKKAKYVPDNILIKGSYLGNVTLRNNYVMAVNITPKANFIVFEDTNILLMKYLDGNNIEMRLQVSRLGQLSFVYVGIGSFGDFGVLGNENPILRLTSGTFLNVKVVLVGELLEVFVNNSVIVSQILPVIPAAGAWDIFLSSPNDVQADVKVSGLEIFNII